MHSKKNVSSYHYDIISNILTEENQINKCTDKIKEYELNLSSIPNKTELIRFSRHITLENYFSNNNHIDASSANKIESIFNELSFITSKDYSDDNDTILIMELSNTLDTFLEALSLTEKKIYIYRYFFAYSIEDIAKLCSNPTHIVQNTLSQCNNKLKNLINDQNLIADNKSLLLSFTDIDDTHLLSVTNNTITKKLSNMLDFIPYKNPKKTLTLYLSIFFGLAILFLILLSIVQFTKNGTSTSSNSSNNSLSENDDVYIEVDGQKIVDGDKLLEKALYMENGGKYNFTYYTNDCYILYTAYNHYLPLSSLKGKEITDLSDEDIKYYTLAGTDSLEYIISESNGSYLFYESSYPYINNDDENIDTSQMLVKYEQILSDFYGIKSFKDLEEIYVMPYDEFNGYADANTKKLISYYDDLPKVYKSLINSTYKGMSVNEYIETHNISHDYLYDNCVKIGIKGKNNIYIEKLLYYAEGNVFIDEFNSAIFEASTDYGKTYLQEMFNINYHTVEPSHPDTWEYTLLWSSLQPSYVDYAINCGPNTDNHGKYVGSDFTLEVFKDNQWTAVPIQHDDIPLVPFKYKLNNDSSNTYVTFFITDKYNNLIAGKYRITITIYDSYSEDKENPAHRDFSAEFNIN